MFDRYTREDLKPFLDSIRPRKRKQLSGRKRARPADSTVRRVKKVARAAGEFASYYAAGDLGRTAYNIFVPRVKNMGGNYAQGTLTSRKRKYGRNYKRGSTTYTNLLSKASVSRIQFGLSDYTTYGGASGSYFLRNYYDTRALTTTTGGYYLPCHLWDVSAVANSNLGAESATNAAQCGYRLGLDNSSGTNVVPRHRTLGQALTLQQGPGTAGSTLTVRSGSMLRGVKAKIMFYCPLTVPCRIKVQLVQILDARLQPSKNATTDTETTRTDFGAWQADNTLLPNDMGGAERHAGNFWLNYMRPNVMNPVCLGSANTKSIKVLKKESFTLNPKETSDNTATTYHMVDFFYAFNRHQKYNWENTSAQVLQGFSGEGQTIAQNRNCVEPRARIFLMITADSVYTSGAADPPADDKNNSASYDISIRTYHDDIV